MMDPKNGWMKIIRTKERMRVKIFLEIKRSKRKRERD